MSPLDVLQDGLEQALDGLDYRPGDDTCVPPFETAAKDYMRFAESMGIISSLVTCHAHMAGGGLLIVDSVFELGGSVLAHRIVFTPGTDAYVSTTA